MNAKNKYIFTSEKPGFRNRVSNDVDKMQDINSDEKITDFFPLFPQKYRLENLLKG